MGVVLARSFLTQYLNREIPEEDYIFRRVPLKLFLQSEPEHRLEIVKTIFRNERGDGMSVDWERICSDPRETQIMDGRNENDFGIVVLSYFDLKRLNERVLKIISDQINYDCHCLVKGIPMSLRALKKYKKEVYDRLSKDVQGKIKSVLMLIREFLIENAFWVIPLNHPHLKDPPSNFNYYDQFTDKIKEFFSSRGHPIPS